MCVEGDRSAELFLFSWHSPLLASHIHPIAVQFVLGHSALVEGL